ncbi:MAG: glycosyltransferase family 4 protein [Pseudomonadota bacterium]
MTHSLPEPASAANDGQVQASKKLKVLLVADDCNPDWPSLPIVAYKYALALGDVADVTIATHVRNRPNLLRARPDDARFVYIDNEWIAAPMNKLAMRLRGGKEVAWSVSVAMRYLPYLAFEWAVWRRFGPALRAGDFDIVHRISPMTPTLPSLLAGRGKAKFVLGPLNGNLDWPAAFRKEQTREKERLRGLRAFYRFLPYARSTQRRSDLVLAAFPHTMAGLTEVRPGCLTNFPEIGYDPEIFHARGRRAPFSGPATFLYAGRLVPYKLPEAAIRAMAESVALQAATLSIVGDGPERARLEALTAQMGLGHRVRFEGRKSQTEVAEAMRAADALVFPSIRELGAGIVIEAMACGLPCIVADYGAPGVLCGNGRGFTLPLAPLDAMVADVRQTMESCLAKPNQAAARAAAAQTYAEQNYTWAQKAAHTRTLYTQLRAGQPIAVEGLFP